MNSTIAAIATAPATAGLGVIRISGNQAVTIAAAVFRPASKERSLERMRGYTAVYGHAADGEGDIDECVALVFRAPHSYTGEDVVELSCHGGTYLLRRVLRALLTAGARPAGPGEFTKRAFINGKLDLTGAESVMTLIEAEGKLAAKAALTAREGAIFRRLQEVRSDLLTASSQLAAYVDYPDEEIPELEPVQLLSLLRKAGLALDSLLDTFETGRILREGVNTVIVGSPNVGKSTLMNCLAGCERSIVTEQAGTTRDVVEDSVRVGEVLLRLSDTAGIRQTEDPVEAIGIERARARLRTAALTLAVFDGSRALTEEDCLLAEEVDIATAIAVINKSDCPPKIEIEYIKNRFQHIVYLSARSGEGVPFLCQMIERVCGVERLTGDEPVLATERQWDCTRRARRALARAEEALRAGIPLDPGTGEIDDAIAAILELTGERVTEAVVDEVFSRFCVGK